MSEYHDEDGSGESHVDSDGYVEILIERGGEHVQTRVPEGSTVQALVENGHLRGVNVVATRVNGAPAAPETPLHAGDKVEQVPRSGKQGD